jgi:hypothetical protein
MVINATFQNISVISFGFDISGIRTHNVSGAYQHFQNHRKGKLYQQKYDIYILLIKNNVLR